MATETHDARENARVIDAAFWNHLRDAAARVGTVPDAPPTLRGFIGRIGVRVLQKLLFWQTDQIRAFQEASVQAHLAESRLVRNLCSIVMRHERILNPSQPADISLADCSNAPQIQAGSGILDQMMRSLPSDQNALDVFRGEWSSMLPHARGLKAGPLPLFEDQRLHWAVSEAGGVTGRRVLELGPLEGGHTYMLQNFGAESITAIESNTRAFLKCLIIKNIFKLDKADFRCGDFLAFLRENRERFDFVVASGVLYHMTNPCELIRLAARAADRVYFWTHYYDEALISRNPGVRQRFAGIRSTTFEGFPHTLHLFEYRESLTRSFTGGTRSHACWMEREDILACLRHFGFNDLRVAFEDPGHQHGPAFAVLAMRV